MQAQGTLHILNYDIAFYGVSSLSVEDSSFPGTVMSATSSMTIEVDPSWGGGWFPQIGGQGRGSGVSEESGFGGAYFQALDGGGEGYAYYPPAAEGGGSLLWPLVGSGLGVTIYHATGGGYLGELDARGYEDLESAAGGGYFAELTGVATGDLYPGTAFALEYMIALHGIAPFATAYQNIIEDLEITDSITTSRILVANVIEDMAITGSITALGDYIASAIENIEINFTAQPQVVYVPDPSIPGGGEDYGTGYYIDTDDDGIDDVYVAPDAQYIDYDGDGVDDTWATEIKVYVDTDDDGTQDTWVGGIGYVDTDNVTVDLPSNEITVDTDGDGTPDTVLGGGEYYDTDGDGTDDLYLTDDQVAVDSDGDGTDDGYITGIGIYVDTDDDGVQDTWVYGAITIITPTETGYIKPVFDETSRVWVVNIDNGATVQYDGYGFNRFFEQDGSYYGVTEDGIYLLEGDDDAGVEIDSLISLGTSNLGIKSKKGITNVYIGASSDGKLIVKFQVDGGTEYAYEARSSSTHIDQHRVDVGKGLVGNYFTLHLLNQDGDDFDIESIHFDPIPLKRRF